MPARRIRVLAMTSMQAVLALRATLTGMGVSVRCGRVATGSGRVSEDVGRSPDRATHSPRPTVAGAIVMTHRLSASTFTRQDRLARHSSSPHKLMDHSSFGLI